MRGERKGEWREIESRGGGKRDGRRKTLATVLLISLSLSFQAVLYNAVSSLRVKRWG